MVLGLISPEVYFCISTRKFSVQHTLISHPTIIQPPRRAHILKIDMLSGRQVLLSKVFHLKRFEAKYCLQQHGNGDCKEFSFKTKAITSKSSNFLLQTSSDQSHTTFGCTRTKDKPDEVLQLHISHIPLPNRSYN